MIISAEEFIKIWQSSKNVAEVAERAKAKSRDTVAHRAWYLRKLGIPLKKFAPGRSGFDIKKLKKLAEQ